jgi:concanavalin A-like lectin/glucanase superfamily protein/type IX secretion system substrate protein/PKD domain-containing protein
MMKKILFLVCVMFTWFHCHSQISLTALRFDGINDYVHIPAPSGFYSVVGSNQFTIEAWIRADGTNLSAEDIILTSRNETMGSNEGFTLSIFNGYLSLWGPAAQTSVQVNIKDGICHHVAVVRQGSTVTAYIDGTAYTNVLADPGDISSSQPVYIGKWFNPFGGFTSYFNGIIKEVRVWSFSRTQSEIQNNMNAVVSSSDPLLVDYFRFNEGTGSVVNDFGDGGFGGNYADIYGNAAWTNACSGCVYPPSMITAGSNTTFCSGGSVTLSANTGAGLTYQWKKNNVNISGATLFSFTVTTAGNYKCVLTNSCGTVSSNVITVTVNSLPSATITPSDPTTFCSGGSVMLNAPIATNRSYQWKKASSVISGATSSSYTATTGGNYKVIVTNTVTGCSKTTATATAVTVNALPAATITPLGPTTFCAGGSVVLQANSGTGLTYKWKKGNSIIASATMQNYTATTAGTYKVIVTNTNTCSKQSAGTVVTVPCRESIRTNKESDMYVFPNPTNGQVTLKFNSNGNSTSELIITDVTGRLVYNETFPVTHGNNEHAVNLSPFVKGLYLLKIKLNEEEVVKSIILQ